REPAGRRRKRNRTVPARKLGRRRGGAAAAGKGSLWRASRPRSGSTSPRTRRLPVFCRPTSRRNWKRGSGTRSKSHRRNSPDANAETRWRGAGPWSAVRECAAWEGPARSRGEPGVGGPGRISTRSPRATTGARTSAAAPISRRRRRIATSRHTGSAGPGRASTSTAIEASRRSSWSCAASGNRRVRTRRGKTRATRHARPGSELARRSSDGGEATTSEDEMDEHGKRSGRGADPLPDVNRDPITGEAGSHPVGTGVGPACGGPAGARVGGPMGATAGGAAGHPAGEALAPTVETEYWRENYHRRPYCEPGTDFSAYEPAYRYGWESATDPTYRDLGFDEAEGRLQSGWSKRSAGQTWDRCRDAVRDAWGRVRESR